MTERPVRVQRKRQKGFRLPPNTKCVTRPGPWGNPFLVCPDRPKAAAVCAFRTWLLVEGCDAGMPERKRWMLDHLHELRGMNLACYCKVGEPCHADVLLEIANGGGAES